MITRTAMARKRDWKKYAIKNHLNYCDCQVVSAVNAYYFLTGKVIGQTSKMYDGLVVLAKAKYGSALCIDKVHDRLGIRVSGSQYSIINHGLVSKLSVKLPVEVCIWHKSYGYHSVLIVDWEPRTASVRVTNFEGVNNCGWIYYEDFQHYLVERPSKKGGRFNIYERNKK